MKILVTGCNGQLGRALRRSLEAAKAGVTTYVDIDTLDLTDAKATEQFLRDGEFSHVVNCAAYTAVDRAEEEKLECAAANIDGIANIARHAEELGLRIIHISTDYVFDGNSNRPYSESDKTAPLSHYGTTKRKSETTLLGLAPDSMIIRTGWLYSSTGSNFPMTMLRLASKGHNELRVVADRIGTPTLADDLAGAITAILMSGNWAGGIYHYADEGVASWYDFAIATLDYAGFSNTIVRPIPGTDYPAAATRPYYSVLDKSRIKATYNIEIPHWQASLRRAIPEMLAALAEESNKSQK